MHRATPRFWRSYEDLPDDAQRLADKCFDLLKQYGSHAEKKELRRKALENMDNWPKRNCSRCGRTIRLVKTKYGWQSYEVESFRPHTCDPLNRAISLFIPKSNPYAKKPRPKKY